MTNLVKSEVQARIEHLEWIQNGRKDWEDSWIGFDTKEKIKGVAALYFGINAALLIVGLSICLLKPLIFWTIGTAFQGNKMEPGAIPSPPMSWFLAPVGIAAGGILLANKSYVYAYNRFTLPEDNAIASELEGLRQMVKE